MVLMSVGPWLGLSVTPDYFRIDANRSVPDPVAVADAHRNLRAVVHPVGLI